MENFVYTGPGAPGVLGGRERNGVGCDTLQVPDSFSGGQRDQL